MTAPDDSPRAFQRRRPDSAPTPLVELPRLAQRAGVAGILVKDESRRALGSFKSLGGTYAGLRALARAVGAVDIASLLAERTGRAHPLPALLCASDGNHGLAVAAAAELAGGAARIFLPSHVPAARERRIAAHGAEIVRIDGTFDDAVDAARREAERGAGLLIADTSTDPDDPVVADVLAGYGVAAEEIVETLRTRGLAPPTHLFVQAGVGGLAAATARGLADGGFALRTVVVEPESVACVGAALRTGRIERLSGDLHTSAEMLSCGEASAPALRILQALRAVPIAVDEPALRTAPRILVEHGGPQTTPSGAAGLAGLLSLVPGTPAAAALGLDRTSRVLLIASEGPVSADPS
jgi:diaminopropionate ammonia-lyase